MKEIDEISVFTDTVVLPKASGKGFKLGAESAGVPGNYSFGWRDITSDVTVRGTGATNPTWTQIGSGPFYSYKFDVGDECWMTFHVPHDIVPGANIHFHTHWLPSGTNTAVVKFQYKYMYAKGFNQEAFNSAGDTTTSQSAGPGVAYQHMVSESAAVTIPTLTEPDGLIYVHVSRITNGGTNNTDSIFVLTSDVHYQSTGLPTIGKAPGFYS